MRDVAVVLPPDPVLFDFAAIWSVFALCPAGHYRLRTCSASHGAMPVHGVMTLAVEDGLGPLEQADLILLPGIMDCTRPQPAHLLEALRRAHARGARIASVCTGAFILAQAGLLDGRRATTHWRRCDELRARFPRVEVDPKVLYIDEGDILTSAGVSAAIDLSLHILRKDCGAEIANKVARHMVFGPHRSGGQAQYIERPLEPQRSRSLEPTRAWILERLDRPITVPEMAGHACLSVRAFARRFQAEMGISPHQWLIRQRIQRAQQILESSDFSIEEVAARCGFGSALSFRQHFKRQIGNCPTAYRQVFRLRQQTLAPKVEAASPHPRRSRTADWRRKPQVPA